MVGKPAERVSASEPPRRYRPAVVSRRSAWQETVGPGSGDSARGVGRFALYAALGAMVGLFVVAIEWTSVDVLLHWLVDAPFWLRITAPGAGVIVAVVVLSLGWRTSAGTSDLYVKAFHGNASFRGRELGPKLTAAVATAGLGGAVGLEGPSIYAGSWLGEMFGRRRLGVLGDRNRRVLLAAGAAAGVAAVFKAPATGVLFALESPYRRDVARQALIPALVAASAAYLTFVLILGSERLLPVGAVEVTLAQEVFGALIIGLAAGLAARGTAWLFHKAKDMSTLPVARRLPVAVALIVATTAAGSALVDAPVMLGPGAEATVAVVLDQSISVWVIVALFGLRALATASTLGAGGVGGVFIPLVVQGLLLGRVAEVLFDAPARGLFPVIALAAMLGAGYRTPLAAVMFVAETTGRSEFVIPALLATAISQSLMGDVSVSTGQVDERRGRLEYRLELPAGEIAIPAAEAASPGDSLLDLVDRLAGIHGAAVVPVVDERYEGLLVLSDIALAVLEHGADAKVADTMRAVPAIAETATAGEAAEIMTQNNTAAVVVTDGEGMPSGLITAAALAGLTSGE